MFCANFANIRTFVLIDDEEEVFDYLKGLRYRNETSNGIMSYASMAGGMELFIDGAGFDFLANINTVLFESDDTECLVMSGTPLDCKYTFLDLRDSLCESLLRSQINFNYLTYGLK